MNTLGRLNQIKLQGFLSIKSMDLKLGQLNVMIGQNGAGKSNLIAFFRFMNKLAQKDLQLHVAQKGGANALLHFGLKATSELQADLTFASNSYHCRLLPSADGGLVFAKESCPFHANRISYEGGRKLAEPGARESGLPAPGTSTIEEHVASYIADWKIHHFHDTSDSAVIKQAGPIHDNRRLREQGENLAAFLYRIRHTESYRDIVTMVQRVAPFFHDFDLVPDERDSIRLRWKHRGTDAYFDASALSDGTLRFMGLTTLLLQPELPNTILLDEPELGLHPYAIQLLAAMMRSASQKTQIIASTQSVTLANEFHWQDLVVVDQHDGESRFRRLERNQVEAWLDAYRLGDLWEKNLLGGTPE